MLGLLLSRERGPCCRALKSRSRGIPNPSCFHRNVAELEPCGGNPEKGRPLPPRLKQADGELRSGNCNGDARKSRSRPNVYQRRARDKWQRFQAIPIVVPCGPMPIIYGCKVVPLSPLDHQLPMTLKLLERAFRECRGEIFHCIAEGSTKRRSMFHVKHPPQPGSDRHRCT